MSAYAEGFVAKISLGSFAKACGAEVAGVPDVFVDEREGEMKPDDVAQFAGEVGEDEGAEDEAGLGAIGGDIGVELLYELLAVLEGGEHLAIEVNGFDDSVRN